MSSLRFPRTDVVEADARRFDRVERLFLHLQRARPFGRARERAAGNRPMIRALGPLQRLERRGMLVLPLEPARQAIECRRFGRAAAFDTERIVVVVAHGVREPLVVAFGRDQTISLVTHGNVFHNPNRAGPIGASIGSTRLSIMADATSSAVNGASST